MRLRAFGITALLAGLAFAPLASAQPDHGPRDPARMQELQQRFERQARLMRLVAISDVLNLTDAQALQLDKTLSKYDERRRPLEQQIFEGVQILRRAAHGDATAYAQVDSTLQKMVQARSQLHAIEFQMFEEIAKGRTPQERAKLALVMARLHGEMRSMAQHPHEGPGGGDER